MQSIIMWGILIGLAYLILDAAIRLYAWLKREPHPPPTPPPQSAEADAAARHAYDQLLLRLFSSKENWGRTFDTLVRQSNGQSDDAIVIYVEALRARQKQLLETAEKAHDRVHERAQMAEGLIRGMYQAHVAGRQLTPEEVKLVEDWLEGGKAA